MPSPWSNLRGPARLVANSAFILLVSSGFLGVEAGVMIVLGEARSIVIKPFVLLGYLEACAIIFSTIGIVCGIIGLVFYRPYLYANEKITAIRARRVPPNPRPHTYFESASMLHVSNPEEDGAPD